MSNVKVDKAYVDYKKKHIKKYNLDFNQFLSTITNILKGEE
jgi:hypothetical protein